MMQTANHERKEDAMPARTLEFRQAMKDFRTMFPTLASNLIECVLRSNNGHVDSTIDQLLQISQDPNGMNNFSRRHALLRGQRNINTYDDSTDSDDSIPSELLDPPTSSDEDIPHRDPPPMYTPRVEDSAPNFYGPVYPVEVPVDEKKKISIKNSKYSGAQAKCTKKIYKAWNPPMLGALPEDFLRILPQQFMDKSTPSREKSKKTTSNSKKRSPANNPLRPTNDASALNRSLQSADKNAPVRHERHHPPTNSLLNNTSTNNTDNTEENLTPPPRPPRTMPLPSNRRMPQYNDRNTALRTEPIERGNLFILPAGDNRNFHHLSMDSSVTANGQQRQRHHRSSSSRSSHGNRCHNLPQSHHQHHPNLPCAATANGNHTRRSSDFSSRRMVMVSRSSEPNIPVSHNGVNNDLNLSLNNERTSHHRSYQRSSSNSFNHHHTNSPGQHSPVFQRGGNPAIPPQSRSSGRPASASASTRARPRTARENEQYVEDWRLAILLQNEEFIRELKRNDDFLKALEKDRPDNTSASPSLPSENTSLDKDIVPSPDPDAKYPHGSQNPVQLKRPGLEDPEKDDEGAFNENLKHMGKSARKKFNEIAKKFSVRRKTSYKSMKNIDPVFANCDDNFDEAPEPRSSVFDL